MNTRRLPIQIISALLLLLTSYTATAQQWYHVELVVFERYGQSAEHWPEMTQVRQGSLSPGMANNIIQPASLGSLSSVVAKLKNNGGYRILRHTAWQQPILAKRSAKGVAINSDDGLLEGMLRLYKVTYLHADLDLWLKENSSTINSWSDASAEGTDLKGPSNPHLAQIRRIKSKNLIYFDHPKLGAILLITPVRAPASAVNDTPESYSLDASASATESE